MPLVARDKKGRAARRATRNTQGKFIKKTKPTIDFFAFPPGIRAIIYTYHFAYERPHRTPRTFQEPKSSLKPKLALLRASKAIRAEAKPIFYRNHVFHIPIPVVPMDKRPAGPNQIIKRHRACPNRLITSVQLTHGCLPSMVTPYWLLERHFNHLQIFLQHLPRLRFLRLGTVVAQLRNHPFARADSCICRMLAKLWQRLNRLEVYMLDDGSVPDWQFRFAIAPHSQWILEGSGAATGGMRGCQLSMWALQRPQRLPNVAGLNNAPE